MPDIVVISVVLALFILLLLAGHYIHTVLALAGIVGLVLLDGPDILTGLLGPAPFNRTAAYTLTTIPLFVLMAQFILQAGVVRDLFWVVKKVGRNKKGITGTLTMIAGAALGAVSGSGTATSASLGQVAVPELTEQGFKPPLAGAVAAAAGSLSGIIPPSIILILYGVATEIPIGDLFIAAIIPGVLITVVFIVVMLAYLRKNKAAEGEQVASGSAPLEPVSRRRIAISLGVSAIIVLVVFGGIYSGTVTPTEAGAVGAFAGLVAALLMGKLNATFLKVSLTETVKVTVMVMIILIGAQIFGRFVSLSLIPRRLIDALEPLVEQPMLLLMIIALIYFVLFMFIEGAAVILMSVPVLLPLIEASGTNLVWFGVFVSMICTIGMITPPVGLSVYAVSGATKVKSDAIFRYAMVFAIVAALVVAVLMVVWPGIATWLPSVAG